jgi:hypothetical protein
MTTLWYEQDPIPEWIRILKTCEINLFEEGFVHQFSDSADAILEEGWKTRKQNQIRVKREMRLGCKNEYPFHSRILGYTFEPKFLQGLVQKNTGNSFSYYMYLALFIHSYKYDSNLCRHAPGLDVRSALVQRTPANVPDWKGGKSTRRRFIRQRTVLRRRTVSRQRRYSSTRARS